MAVGGHRARTFASPRSTVASAEARPVPSPRSEAARGGVDLERATRLGHRFEAAPAHDAAPGHPAPGHPLPEGVRGRFEKRFGADFGDVRVHRESTIPPSPLHAFTRGAHLHFAPTRYRPDTPAGDALIGHELAHVLQQREGRVTGDGGKHAEWNSSPDLEREARSMGDRAAAGEPLAAASSAASKPQAAAATPPAQAGLFDLMGAANPRLYAPTWLGGHSEEHQEERQWQGRTGPFDMLGPLNPRLHLPTALGGHSEEHLAERRQQRRSGPFDLLGPLNPRLHLPTVLGGHSREHLAERAVQGRSGPLDLLGPLNPRQYLPTRLGGHSYTELSNRQRNGTDGSLTALPRSIVGRGIRRVGKATGIRPITNLGRRMHYGHLSPEQLLKQHPSAFLRTHPIESDVEWGGHVQNLPASTRQRFFLSRYRASGPHPPGYTLHRADDPRNAQVRNPRGPVFRAGFLPMRQMAADGNAPHTVAPNGRITDAALDHAHEDVTLTTQLSGCSITHQGGCLRHLRPHTSGAVLNANLENRVHGSTYGRADYPVTSFVMMKKKANGRTRLYDQQDNNPATSGRRYIS